jgi:hypothetical protein
LKGPFPSTNNGTLGKGSDMEYSVVATFKTRNSQRVSQAWSYHDSKSQAYVACKGSLVRWNRLLAIKSDIVKRYPGTLESLEVTRSKVYLSLEV